MTINSNHYEKSTVTFLKKKYLRKKLTLYYSIVMNHYYSFLIG